MITILTIETVKGVQILKEFTIEHRFSLKVGLRLCWKLYLANKFTDDDAVTFKFNIKFILSKYLVSEEILT